MAGGGIVLDWNSSGRESWNASALDEVLPTKLKGISRERERELDITRGDGEDGSISG